MLGIEPPECLDLICPEEDGTRGGGEGSGESALSLVTRAEYLYLDGCMEDAFRVAGQVRVRPGGLLCTFVSYRGVFC